MTIKTKSRIKSAIIIALVIALSFAAVSLVTSFFKKPGKDADGFIEVSLSFDVGGIDETGKYVESADTLYTKESYPAQTVKVNLDFNSTVKYTVFFYDEYDNFISSGLELSKGSRCDVPEGAKSFRLQLSPVWPDDVDDDDCVLNFFNKFEYINQITVSVVEWTAPTDSEDNPGNISQT